MTHYTLIFKVYLTQPEAYLFKQRYSEYGIDFVKEKLRPFRADLRRRTTGEWTRHPDWSPYSTTQWYMNEYNLMTGIVEGQRTWFLFPTRREIH